jgi:hypothetical protein
MSTFTVAGVSFFKNKFKVRYANDMMRIKALSTGGHTHVDLVELPSPMTKGEAVKHLQTLPQFAGEARAAIDAADAKYNGSKTIKVSGVTVKAKSSKAKSAEDSSASEAETQSQPQ